MICQNCGQETPDGMSFCMNCGNKLIVPEPPKTLEAWDYCPTCGEKVPANSAFCGNCGSKITNPIPTIGTDLKTMPVAEPAEPVAEPITLQTEPEIPAVEEPITLETTPAEAEPVQEPIVLETVPSEPVADPKPALDPLSPLETEAAPLIQEPVQPITPAPAPTAAVCPNCGNPVEPGEIFCSTCGTKLVTPAPATPMQPVQQTSFCSTCGSPITPGVAFCSVCGTRVGNPAAVARETTIPPQLQKQGGYTAPVIAPVPSSNGTNTTYAQPAYNPNLAATPAGEKPRGMKWFKFVIYFALFAGALINLITGISYLTGLTYSAQGSSASIVYSFFPALSIVDKIYGILLIGMAAFAIVVRFQLAKFKKNGPMLYIILMIAAMVLSILYSLGANLLLNSYGASIGGGQILQELLTPLGNIIMIVLNVIYFRNRKDLFTN